MDILEKVDSTESVGNVPVEELEIFTLLSTDDVASFVLDENFLWKDVSNSSPIFNYKRLDPGSDTIHSVRIDIIDKATLIIAIKLNKPCVFFQSAIFDLLPFCTNLRHLDVRNVTTYKVHIEFLTHLSKIESFHVYLRSQVPDANRCVVLLERYNHLRRIEIQNPVLGYSWKADIRDIVDKWSKLEYVDFSKLICDRMHLTYLMEKRKDTLKTIKFNGQCVVPGHSLPFGQCKHLEHIYCLFDLCCPYNSFLPTKIISSPKILSLEFVGLRQTNWNTLVSFFQTQWFPNLIKLNLSRYFCINPSLAKVITQRLKGIKILCLNGCFRLSACCVELLKLKNLEHLELQYIGTMSCRFYIMLTQCKNLKYLDLYGSKIRNSDALDVVKFLKLEFLNIGRCWFLTDTFLKEFPQSTSLKKLLIHECLFSEPALIDLRLRICPPQGQTIVSSMDVKIISVPLFGNESWSSKNH